MQLISFLNLYIKYLKKIEIYNEPILKYNKGKNIEIWKIFLKMPKKDKKNKLKFHFKQNIFVLGNLNINN